MQAPNGMITPGLCFATPLVLKCEFTPHSEFHIRPLTPANKHPISKSSELTFSCVVPFAPTAA
jgi:hypothetical protein